MRQSNVIFKSFIPKKEEHDMVSPTRIGRWKMSNKMPDTDEKKDRIEISVSEARLACFQIREQDVRHEPNRP
jgi:hypothetical protein